MKKDPKKNQKIELKNGRKKSFPGLCNVNKCGQINVIFTKKKKRLIGKQNTYENEVNLITIKLYSRPLDLLFFCFKG